MGLSGVLLLAAMMLATPIRSERCRREYNASAETQNLEEEARKFLKEYDAESGKLMNYQAICLWNHASNLTKRNEQLQINASLQFAAFEKKEWPRVRSFPWNFFKDFDIRRQLMKLSVLGDAALPFEKFYKLRKVISDMQSIYSKAKVCSFYDSNKCNLTLEPDLTEILSTSQDARELRHVWVKWREESGKKTKNLFREYVALQNEAAVLNNFTDKSEMWLNFYEDGNFTQDLQHLWGELQPLYLELHAYVRKQLRVRYGDSEVSKDGPIPAHLLGNMWAQSWENVFSFSKPFPKAQHPDVTENMLKQNYTPEMMFRLSEQFFTSLNLNAMPAIFWQRSILKKPRDRDIVCHASAWDFADGKDFRIKQCTRVNMMDLFVAHHEMGHIQYYLQYKHLPRIYRKAANPGFHEAVGDVIALSVSTPKHLHKVGLLDKKGAEKSVEADINFLYLQALRKIAILPFSYLVDLWRWNVFNGTFTDDKYNSQWWNLRVKYQGVEQPVDRSEEDFDAGAKYHVIADVPYIRYFVSSVLQFQIHRALCLEASEFDPNDPSKPLHSCDIFGSEVAGKKLKAMLQLGGSKPWPEALQAVTGIPRMDASGILDYFHPLTEWLKKENHRTGEHVGWKPTKRVCVSRREELTRQT